MVTVKIALEETDDGRFDIRSFSEGSGPDGGCSEIEYAIHQDLIRYLRSLSEGDPQKSLTTVDGPAAIDHAEELGLL